MAAETITETLVPLCVNIFYINISFSGSSPLTLKKLLVPLIKLTNDEGDSDITHYKSRVSRESKREQKIIF